MKSTIHTHNTEKEATYAPVAPLIRLQQLLVQEFPYCNDVNIKSDNGYNPHMTISHFPNHHDAIVAAQELQEEMMMIQQQQSQQLRSNSSNCSSDSSSAGNNNNTPLEFLVDYIYLLERYGDNGQFVRIADIPLGSSTTTTNSKKRILQLHDPIPQPFPFMPTMEEDWVYEERMKLKLRRNGKKRNYNKRR
jgi:hypothetical protein